MEKRTAQSIPPGVMKMAKKLGYFEDLLLSKIALTKNEYLCM